MEGVPLSSYYVFIMLITARGHTFSNIMYSNFINNLGSAILLLFYIALYLMLMTDRGVTNLVSVFLFNLHMTHHCDLGCVCSVDGLGYVPLFICLIFIDNSPQFCSWMDGNLS